MFVLALRDPDAGAQHLVGYAADGTVAGYAQVDDAGSAELVVAPEHRRAGLGRALAERLVTAGAERVWSHGDLPAARALAASLGWDRVRDLYRMERALSEADGSEVELPEGFLARAFEPGADDEAWVETNAAAFASHPEQGRITLADLRARMELPWFDPAGLVVVEDTRREAGAPAIAAFHWTKVDPSADGGGAGSGEVYVVAVHPAYQGRGLGTPVTRLGLAHLVLRGLQRVDLYVDGDNEPARRTYAALGFEDASVDVMYAVAAAR